MASITVTYLPAPDLGRVRIELFDLTPNVRYQVQRSIDGGVTWVDVRGASNLSTTGMTIADDYEYKPNVENRYRLIAPVFYDSFNRAFPPDATLALPGTSGSFASTPDDPSLDIVGDIELGAELDLDDWSTVQRGLGGKWEFTTGDERSYLLTLESDGHLRIHWSTDGTAANQMSLTSSDPVPITTGRLAVRATLNVDLGGTDTRARFFTGDSISTATDALGGAQDQVGVTSIHAGAAPLEIGSWNLGTEGELDGNVYAARVQEGIGGTTVAFPRFDEQTPGTTSFNDSTGKTWTVHGDAEIIDASPDTDGDSWGTADTGHAWNLVGSSPEFSAYVDNGVGVMASNAPAGNTVEFLTDTIPGATDAEITYSGILPSETDQPVEFDVGVRASDAANWYESQMVFFPDRDVQIRISKVVGGVFTALTALLDVGSWTPGVRFNVRFRVNGQQLSMRAWIAGEMEPRDWQVTTTDTDLTTGTAVHVRGLKSSGDAYEQWFGPMSMQTIPVNVDDTAVITPMQSETFLKSITYPLFNRQLECVDWQELTRDSRNAFFDIKGRHSRLGIADVGSSASFALTFVTRSTTENRALVGLLTFGGVMLLQPPGDDESIECPTEFSGTPAGYVMVEGEHVQRRTVYGKPLWQWEVVFTRVDPNDSADILPTTITWAMLWDIIGPDGTWEDVWAMWPTWQELWLTQGSPEAFEG